MAGLSFAYNGRMAPEAAQTAPLTDSGEYLSEADVDAATEAITMGDVWQHRHIEDAQERGLRAMHRAAMRTGLHPNGNFDAFLDRLPLSAFKKAKDAVEVPTEGGT